MRIEDIYNETPVRENDSNEMINNHKVIIDHFRLNEQKFGYRYMGSQINENVVEVRVMMRSDNELPCEIFNLFDFRIDSFYRINTDACKEGNLTNQPVFIVKVQFL